MVYFAHALAVEGVVGEGKIIIWGGKQTKGELHKYDITKNMFLHSNFLTSLSSSLTQLFFMILKLALQGNKVKI